MYRALCAERRLPVVNPLLFHSPSMDQVSRELSDHLSINNATRNMVESKQHSLHEHGRLTDWCVGKRVGWLPNADVKANC